VFRAIETRSTALEYNDYFDQYESETSVTNFIINKLETISKEDTNEVNTFN